MKRTKQVLIALFALVLIACSLSPVLAIESNHSRWPEFTELSNDRYLAQRGYVHFNGKEQGYQFSVTSYLFVIVYFPEGESLKGLKPEYFTTAKNVGGSFVDSGQTFENATQPVTRCRVSSVSDNYADYSTVQYWRFYDSESDRSVVLPVYSVVDNQESDSEILNKLTCYTERAEKLVQLMKQFDALYDTLEASQNSASVKIGSLHPSDINRVCMVANAIQSSFDITITYDAIHDYWVEGEGWETATAEDIIRHWTTTTKPRSEEILVTETDTITGKELSDLDLLLDVVAPYWLDYVSSHVIETPAISYFTLAGSRGVIDSDARTVTVRMPSDTAWGTVPDPMIETSGEAKVTMIAGDFMSGQVIYRVTPCDRATGTYYDGQNLEGSTGYNFGVDLGVDWNLIVEEGAPFTKVLSFTVKTEDGKSRKAFVTDPAEESKGIITLNLPYGTDLSTVETVVDYAGEGYYFTVDGSRVDAGSEIDFSRDVDLVVYNIAYDTSSVYTVNLTANKSSENDIISYRIGDSKGEIDGDTVRITIPYAMDLSNAEAVVEVSEFAELTGKPARLSVGNNEYVVTAENGASRTYTVIITRAAISEEKNILSFKYGGYSAEIDESTSSITLELPNGLSVVFAPEIVVSEFATVSPASGETRDFTNPVKYYVTAQDGSSKVYTVTVSVQSGPVYNPYKDRLAEVVNKIITRYKSGNVSNWSILGIENASDLAYIDDWYWFDIGLYENVSENYGVGRGKAFTIEEILTRGLDVNAVGGTAMTDIARRVMVLTARGFDCSELSKYNNGQPFKDSKGNDVDDLVSKLYSYSGEYSINGPAYALLALDMGSYTVPEDAVWTRANLIRTLVECPENGTDGWGRYGIDMAGGIMYSIAPYQDDPLYGIAVRGKLDELLCIVVQRMNSDYSFGAWGAQNSESAAWVMMGLCSMGIDWNVDPRFADGHGHSALQNWMDNFVNEQDGCFHHNSSLLNNYMATYEGCYAGMWYLGFLDHGGQGSPYYYYYHRFDFSKALSDDASILGFEIEGRLGTITEGESNTIEITLPRGTPLSNIQPKITFAEGAKLVSPNLPVTFVEGVSQPFVVRAEDGQTYKIYNVTITYDNSAASGAELYLDTLKVFNNRQIEESATKNVTKAADGATEVLLTVRPQVDTSKMYLYAEASYEANCDPVLDGNTLMDLSDWITVTVTSQDGSNVNVYRIKVEAKQQAEITSFCVIANGVRYTGTIDNTQNTIVVRDVDDTNLTSTVLDTEIVFTGLTCVPSSGIATDFASSVTYMLGGDSSLASRSYTVSVLNKEGTYIKAKGSGSGSGDQDDNEVKILSFKVLGVSGAIDQDSGIITVTLPQGTDVRAVVPEIVLTQCAAVCPAQGQVVNLSSPVVYTVSASGKTRSYIVSVVYERTISQQLWDALSEESDVVDHQISYGRRLY